MLDNKISQALAKKRYFEVIANRIGDTVSKIIMEKIKIRK